MCRTEEIDKICERFAKELGEFVDHANFMISFENEKGETQGTFAGFGNWHARRGLAQEFLDREIARSRCDIEHFEYRTGD